MIARVPQMSASSQVTIGFLQRLLKNNKICSPTLSSKLHQLFQIREVSGGIEYDYPREMTLLTTALVESMFGFVQNGNEKLLDEYFEVLKEYVQADTKPKHPEVVTTAKNLISSYCQSSLGVCHVYSWQDNYGYSNNLITKILRYACELLTCSLLNKETMLDLTAISSSVALHWRIHIESVNYARLYILSSIASAYESPVADKNLYAQVACGIFAEADKDSWAFAFVKCNTDSKWEWLKRLHDSVGSFVWDPAVQLMTDAKVKRRICERAQPIKTMCSMSTRDINTMAKEAINPMFIELLSMCSNVIQVTAEDAHEAEVKTDMFSRFDVSRFVAGATALEDKLASTTEICEKYQAEITELKAQNERLLRKCNKAEQHLADYRKREHISQKDSSSKIEQELRRRIDVLTAEVASYKKYVASLSKAQIHTSNLTQRINELTAIVETLTEENKELQECCDELLLSPTTEETEYVESTDSLTESELTLLKRIRAYAIVPDTDALHNLDKLMPASRIVHVGQYENINRDVPTGYEIYMYVTAMSGHKVYNKWRNKVNALQLPYCHCSTAGYKGVARKLLYEYNRQILSK